MSLPPVSLPLNPWILRDPQKRMEEFEKQRETYINYDRLSTITLIAIAVISLAVLAFSFAAGTATGGVVPYVLAGLVISTISLCSVSSRLRSWAREVQGQVDFEEMVIKEHEHITSKYTEAQLQQACDVSHPEISLSPLIARIEVLIRDVVKPGKLEADRYLGPSVSDCRKRQTILKKNVWPQALDAAFAYHLIPYPYFQGDLSTLGEPQSETDSHGKPDTYFQFRDSERKLTLSDLEEVDFDPKQVRFKLFPPRPPEQPPVT